MKTFLGVLLGFSLMPAIFGMLGPYAFATVKLQLSMRDAIAGVLLALAFLLSTAFVAIVMRKF